MRVILVSHTPHIFILTDEYRRDLKTVRFLFSLHICPAPSLDLGDREVFSIGCFWFFFGGVRRRRAPVDLRSAESRVLIIIFVFLKCLCASWVVPVSLRNPLYTPVYGSF
jgi:hypothetical protein